MIIKQYKNLNDDECLIVENENGSIWSGLKSAYDEMIANETASL
jgi:hypothetical protein